MGEIVEVVLLKTLTTMSQEVVLRKSLTTTSQAAPIGNIIGVAPYLVPDIFMRLCTHSIIIITTYLAPNLFKSTLMLVYSFVQSLLYTITHLVPDVHLNPGVRDGGVRVSCNNIELLCKSNSTWGVECILAGVAQEDPQNEVILCNNNSIVIIWYYTPFPRCPPVPRCP